LHFPLLSLLIFLPLVFGAIIVAVASSGRAEANTYRSIGLAGSVVTAAVVLFIVMTQYSWNQAGYQLVEQTSWLPALNSSYHLGLDGLSLLLVILTVLITPIAILVSSESITERTATYVGLVLLLETALLGVFLSLDLILYYVFWEGVLIPTYLLIGVWGGTRRVYAAIKYVLYTMVGSLLMLVGVVGVYVYSSAHTFDIPALSAASASVSVPIQTALLVTFALAFGIKSALWPFHSWAPDVYTESATPTTIMLSGVVSKMGVYGFLRIALPIFPMASHNLAPIGAAFAVVGILYGALLALTQTDAKRLVACSSISHMGFILLGVFALNAQGVQGATLQMLNHGVTTTALFVIVGAIAWRWGTTDLGKIAGLGRDARVLAAVFLLVTLSSLGLPGLNSFAGEFLILLGAFENSSILGILGTVGVILAAWYMLRLFQGAMHGPEPEATANPARGFALRNYEMVALVPLLVLIVWIGVAPGGWLHPDSYVTQMIVHTVSTGGR